MGFEPRPLDCQSSALTNLDIPNSGKYSFEICDTPMLHDLHTIRLIKLTLGKGT